MTTVEIERMSTAERLRVMEDLWDRLCVEDEEIQSPDWHSQILAKRQKKIEPGNAGFISIEDLKKSVRASR